MKAKSSIEIKSSKEEIWQFVSDHTKWADHIVAILSVDVIENPDTFLGFKWKEKRKMFGKEAEETMWVTDVEENKFYKTRAESHGSVYLTTVTIEEQNDSCILSQEFEGLPQTIMGKIMMTMMGGMMKKSTEKALYDDLKDIKSYIEKQ